MPWVTLRSIKNIREGGVQRTYHPGDSVKVGKQTALQWVLDGSAEDPFAQVGPPMTPSEENEYGIRVLAEEGSVALDRLGKYATSLEVTYGPPEITHEYTCLWEPTFPLTEKLLSYGFLRIMSSEEEGLSWEMAACLASLTTLARDVGEDPEKAKTKSLVGDLRLPVYEPRVLWASQTENARRVVSLYGKELEQGADRTHAFLRSLYSGRALLCTLPVPGTL